MYVVPVVFFNLLVVLLFSLFVIVFLDRVIFLSMFSVTVQFVCNYIRCFCLFFQLVRLMYSLFVTVLFAVVVFNVFGITLYSGFVDL